MGCGIPAIRIGMVSSDMFLLPYFYLFCKIIDIIRYFLSNEKFLKTRAQFVSILRSPEQFVGLAGLRTQSTFGDL